MIYEYDKTLQLSNTKVVYIQHGKRIEQFVTFEGKEWWIEFEKIWSHTQIIEFIDLTYTQEQLDRLEGVKYNTYNDLKKIYEYVITGIMPEGGL